MWRCPRCQLNMTMSEERCKKCSRELQFFENVLNYGLEQMIIEVPVQKLKKGEAPLASPDSYWRCKICRETQLLTQSCKSCGKSLERALYTSDLDELLVSGPDDKGNEGARYSNLLAQPDPYYKASKDCTLCSALGYKCLSCSK